MGAGGAWTNQLLGAAAPFACALSNPAPPRPACPALCALHSPAGGTPRIQQRSTGRQADLAARAATPSAPTCSLAARWQARGCCRRLGGCGCWRRRLRARLACAAPFTPAASACRPAVVGHAPGAFQGAETLEWWVKADKGQPQVTVNIGGGAVRWVGWGWLGRQRFQHNAYSPQLYWKPTSRCLSHQQRYCSPVTVASLPVLETRAGGWAKFAVHLGSFGGRRVLAARRGSACRLPPRGRAGGVTQQQRRHSSPN